MPFYVTTFSIVTISDLSLLTKPISMCATYAVPPLRFILLSTSTTKLDILQLVVHCMFDRFPFKSEDII